MKNGQKIKKNLIIINFFPLFVCLFIFFLANNEIDCKFSE